MTVDATANIVGYDDYYPYGMVMSTRSFTSSPDNRYKFTSKERDAETTYDYFGARYYDSRIGRWMSVDPLADEYPSWSPYNYCLNNPIKNIDPDGRDGGGHWVLDPNGVKVWVYDEVTVTAIKPFNNWWAIGGLAVGWGIALVEPTPVGEAIMYDLTMSAVATGLISYQLFNEGDEEVSDGEKEHDRKYSDHAKKRMKEGNISKDRVEEAIKKGRTQPGNTSEETEHYLPGSQSISGKGIRVITNSKGEVVTVTNKGTSWHGGSLWK